MRPEPVLDRSYGFSSETEQAQSNSEISQSSASGTPAGLRVSPANSKASVRIAVVRCWVLVADDSGDPSDKVEQVLFCIDSLLLE